MLAREKGLLLPKLPLLSVQSGSGGDEEQQGPFSESGRTAFEVEREKPLFFLNRRSLSRVALLKGR